MWRGHSEAVLPLFKEVAAFFLASIGVSVGWPRTGGADGEKYNYGEIVSRLKTAYSKNRFSEGAGEGTGKQP